VDLGALTTARARVLNLLEPVKLTVWKVMIERVTVVKFRVNYRGGNGAGCFELKVDGTGCYQLAILCYLLDPLPSIARSPMNYK